MVAVRVHSVVQAARRHPTWTVGCASTVIVNTQPAHLSVVTPNAGSLYISRIFAPDTHCKKRRDDINRLVRHRHDITELRLPANHVRWVILAVPVTPNQSFRPTSSSLCSSAAAAVLHR